jgi:tRNA threonylcarbamoyladenosine biosynthesis protein TsaB
VRIVALETSGLRGSVAALAGSKELLQLELNPEQRSAQSLAPAIRQLLAEVGWRPVNVELLAVTIGPGSFTGLRVGVTTAKVMAYAVGAQLISVTTLEAIAEQLPAEVQRAATILDAQRQQLYVGNYVRRDDTSWELENEIKIESIDDWLTKVDRNAVVSGPPLAKLTARLPAGVVCAPQDVWFPMATSVGRVGFRHFQAGQRSDPFQLTPLYLRRSAAEEKSDASQKK